MTIILVDSSTLQPATALQMFGYQLWLKRSACDCGAVQALLDAGDARMKKAVWFMRALLLAEHLGDTQRTATVQAAMEPLLNDRVEHIPAIEAVAARLLMEKVHAVVIADN